MQQNRISIAVAADVKVGERRHRLALAETGMFAEALRMEGIFAILALREDVIAAARVHLEQHVLARLIDSAVGVGVAACGIFHIEGIQRLSVRHALQRIYAVRQFPAPLQIRRGRLRRRRNQR